MKFFYLKVPLGAKSATLGNYLLKPIIPIRISYKDKSAKYAALIDSGADFCIFDAHIGDYLGIEVRSGEKEAFGGVQEAGLATAYFHEVGVTIGDWEYKTNIGFSYDIAKYGYGILGQKGFFSLFKITFNYGAGEMELISNNKS